MLIFRGVSTTLRIPSILLERWGWKTTKQQGPGTFLQTPPVIFLVLLSHGRNGKRKAKAFGALQNEPKENTSESESPKTTNVFEIKNNGCQKILINSHFLDRKIMHWRLAAVFLRSSFHFKTSNDPQPFSINPPLGVAPNKTPDLSSERFPNFSGRKMRIVLFSVVHEKRLRPCTWGGQTAPRFSGRTEVSTFL